MKLNKETVDAAEAGPARRYLWDNEIKGLGLRVEPTGAKSFVLVYRTTAGKQQWLTIGKLGKVTPAQARAEAKRLLGDVVKGEDPQGERSAARAALTMGQLFDRFLRDHVTRKAKPLKPRTAAEYRRIVEKQLRPALGRIKVAELVAADVERLHRAMGATERAANHALAVLSKCMTLAEKWGERPLNSNPCSRLERYPEPPRNRVLTPAERVRLGEVLQQAELDGSIPRAAINAVRLLALTGCRLSEILTLQWGHVDFERGLLVLPDSKTGPAVRTLGSRTAMLLASLPRVSEWVIPAASDSTKPMPAASLWWCWKRLRARAGLDDVHIHDLRHGVGTAAASTGAAAFAIRDLLGHADVRMTNRYVSRDAGLRTIADRVEQHIGAELMGWGSEVVALKGNR
jgi:integrase